jgi:hypothetical protein
MMKALIYSETSILPKDTRRNIPEDAILHSHSREKLNSCTMGSSIFCAVRAETL